ncbi:MAG: hypothetical protein ACK4ZU_02060 [Allorhizobium sp.]
MTDDAELLVGHKAIARFLGLSPRFVSWHDEQGRLPTFRMGKSVCARKSTIRQWLEEMEKSAAEKLT